MKLFKALNRVGLGKKKHNHIAYINEEAQLALVSTAKDGHTHDLVFQPPTEAQYAPDGVTIVQEATEGGWVIYPGPDGHTHILEDVQLEFPEEELDEEKEVSEVLDLYKTAREITEESFDAGVESEEFCMGLQWEPGLKQQIEAQNKPALTINKVLRGRDELVGYEIEQRTDIKYAPFEDGDQRVADLYSIVAKQIQEQCYYNREKTKAFTDTVTAGMGVFNLYVDHDRDIRGEVKIERFPWKDIVFGPHEKEDLSDCEYVVKRRRFSVAKLKQLWPKKADDVSKTWDLICQEMGDGTIDHKDDEYLYPDTHQIRLHINGEDLYDLATKEILVLECWRNVYGTAYVAALPDDDFYFNLEGWTAADRRAIQTLPGFKLIEKGERRIRITKIAGTTLLSDENPARSLPLQDFFVAPCYAYKVGNTYRGKVEATKDPQREINKRHSQLTDIINKTANYNYFVDKSTFLDEKEGEKFVTNSTMPGAIFWVNDTNHIPTKTEGVKFPSEIVQLIQLEDAQIMDIMNITVDQGGANTSAQALMQRRELRLKGNEFLYDNLQFAQVRVGRLLLHLIRKYYTPDRIYRIVSSADARQPVEVGGQPLSYYSEEEIISILANADVDKYDVVVVESPHSPTVRAATYAMLSEMAQAGQPVPPELLIEAAPLSQEFRQKALDSLAAQSEQQSSVQSETAKMEINKTLIAQGIIPPEVAEQAGLTPGQTLGAMQQGMPELGGVGEGAPMQEVPMPEEMPAPEAPPAEPRDDKIAAALEGVALALREVLAKEKPKNIKEVVFEDTPDGRRRAVVRTDEDIANEQVPVEQFLNQ